MGGRDAVDVITQKVPKKAHRRNGHAPNLVLLAFSSSYHKAVQGAHHGVGALLLPMGD